MRIATAPAPERAAAPARERGRTPAIWLVVAGGALIVLAATLLRLAGGNWFIVQTPSMGTAAPVGSLVVTMPVGHDRLAVGDVIAFHPPTQPTTTYTHRIAGIDPNGLITTRGDVNGAVDGWRLPPALVVGRAVALVPGLGWLVRALPVLITGGAAVWFGTARLRSREQRIALRLTGLALVLTAVIAWLRPLIDVTTLEVTSGAGAARALLVSTGLLPVRVSAADGRSVDLVAGEVQSLATRTPVGGHYMFDVGLDLPWYGWLLLAVVCLAPTAAGLLLARRPRPA